ncbi:unnamed protein product [Chilo suppressalis]|uniref:Fatty acid desaturase domain-containing protein n=1 Tax=Chilo suppressalis TaxID=168631 RepID=A0ABN8AUL1_CHISP|nr:unnamed protein product [Chilo suppressalis]
MAPNSIQNDEGLGVEVQPENLTPPKLTQIRHKILYVNLTYFLYWHLAAPYGIYLCFTSVKWETIIFGFVVFLAAELGVTAGAHRLWSHKSYKAKRPLEIILMLFNSMAFQNSIIHWARDHRLHHKYCDTDADPYNASRGFFYSHVGWLLTKKNKEVLKRGKTIDASDLFNNPVLQFQKKYAIPVFALCCFILPTAIPMYVWGETLNYSWHANLLRYTINLNVTFLVNSAAHIWGYRPYDKSIYPAQNVYVSLVTLGEGFHNYHHVFPWDYKTAELGNNKLNVTTWFINFFTKLGWAYDLKTVSNEIVRARAMRTGDGKDLWGWNDKDITDMDMEHTDILYSKTED